jgi:hypothetical protein
MTRSIDELSPPFYVIEMPFNERGQGPETDPAKVVAISWEVWDQLFLTVCSTGDEATARLIAQRLNA